MAKRFFVDKNDIKIDGEIINITGTEVRHINVLRHKVGDNIRINEYLINIQTMNKEEITGKIIETENLNRQSNIAVTLYQSYIKADKMEFVVQKAVELGVDKIVPFLSKNCVVKLDNKDKLKKIERLNKISVEASKQCNRNDIVKVENILEINDRDTFISRLNENDINILAYEKSHNSLKETLKRIIENNQKDKVSISIIIGPEGGFDDSDMQVLQQANSIHEISLGTRILRAETASLNLLSIINYVFEN